MKGFGRPSRTYPFGLPSLSDSPVKRKKTSGICTGSWSGWGSITWASSSSRPRKEAGPRDFPRPWTAIWASRGATRSSNSRGEFPGNGWNGWWAGRSPVLVEGTHPETELLLTGRLPGQAPEVDGSVILTSGMGETGRIMQARVTVAHDYDVEAELVLS